MYPPYVPFRWIGVDPGATRVAAVLVEDEEPIRWMSVRKLAKRGGPDAARAQRQALLDFVWQNPAVQGITVEVPVAGPRQGVQGLLSLAYSVGALATVDGVEFLGNTQWKKSVVGRGNATKQDVAEWVRSRWPDLAAAADGDQDLLDAACIALAGSRVGAARRLEG